MLRKGVVMAVIYCPDCDSEIPENETVCPSCGFDLATFDEEEEEFNDLLNAANMKLSEEAEAETEHSGDNDSKNISISQSQIDALLDGNVVDLTGLDAAVSKVSEKMEIKEKPVEKKPEMPSLSGEDVPAAKPEPKPAPAKKEKVKVKKEKPVKTKKASDKSSLPMIVTIAASVVSLALGFCVAMFIFMDPPRTAEEAFAVRSANALNSVLGVNERLFVYDAYVRKGSAVDECILYAITEYDGNVTDSKYRVTVDKSDSNTINIYYELDETSPEYIAMRDSMDPEVRIQASVLKNYSDQIEAAHREILIGTPSWISVDISEINSNITSIQRKTVEAASAD